MTSLVQSRIDAGEKPPEKPSPEWDALVAEIEAVKGHRICGRRRNNRLKPWVNGWPCERRQMHNGLCHKHGGKSPEGFDHPSFKHGKYSKVLGGTSLQELYLQARSDPDLLSLNEEISVLAAKLSHTLMRLSRGESRSLWQVALSRMKHVRKLLTKEAYDEVDRAVADLEESFQFGLNDQKVWEEWSSDVETLRKLVDTERKHRESEQLNLTAERGMLMVTIWSAAARNVLSPEQAKVLRDEASRIRNLVYNRESSGGLTGQDITHLLSPPRSSEES